MSEALLDAMPPGGWTTNDLDRMPVSNTRYELTDGALTATPSPSNLHQMLLIKLGARMDAEVPEPNAAKLGMGASRCGSWVGRCGVGLCRFRV